MVRDLMATPFKHKHRATTPPGARGRFAGPFSAFFLTRTTPPHRYHNMLSTIRQAEVLMGPDGYHVSFKNQPLVFLALSIFLLAAPHVGAAFQGWGETAAGYDDNVTQSRESAGSGFVTGRFGWIQGFFQDSPTVDAFMGMDGYYRNFFSMDDRYQIGISTGLDAQVWRGRLYPGIKLSAVVYRDGEVPEDDTRWLEADIHADAVIHGRLTLGAQLTHTRFDYQDRVTLPRLSLQGPTMSGPGPGPGSKDREDELTMGRLTGTLFWGPSTTLMFRLESGHNHSSISRETYDLYGSALGLTWIPTDNWQIHAMLTIQSANYDSVRQNTDREDDIRLATLKISRFFKDFELFLQIDQLDINSTLETESYTQWVNQCGVTYSF